MPPPTHDPADEAMCGRARERFTADRKRGGRVPRRRRRHAALPNLIIIGGLKCGTTSIHHYLGLHPEIQMSKPKELNFFVEELNWDLGLDWYAAASTTASRSAASPPLTTRTCPASRACAERIHDHVPDAKLIYMVRDPIKRILSHWCHATGAGYETRPMEEALARADQTYVTRSRYWMQLQPYLELLRPRPDRGDHPGGAADRPRGDDAQGLRLRRRRSGLHLGAVRPRVGEVERQGVRRYQFMERLIKLPGFRSFDRNFDRLPERMRWMVEKVVHDPEAPPAPKPELPDDRCATH